ncbi:ComEC/Rec2 family competence protein [Desulfovibrio sp. OttesenSCG-928-F07]|nr:ComEC/Rec2 family competence protein [Desulfovibrio sp. OttesenSCG-928-F07]
MSTPNRLWPQMLFWQLLCMAFFAGVFASRFLLPTVMALSLLILHQWPKFAGTKRKTIIRLSCVLLIFALSYSYANLRYYQKPTVPAWLTEYIYPGPYYTSLEAKSPQATLTPKATANIWQIADNPVQDNNKANSAAFKSGLRVRARVDQVQGAGDRNLRMVLSHIQPLEATTPYTGRLVFTWNAPLTPEAPKAAPAGQLNFATKPGKAKKLERRPVTGDIIELTLRPRMVRSLQNPGLWETEQYWADQNVWLRGWANAHSPELELVNYESFNAVTKQNEQKTTKLIGKLTLNSITHTTAKRREHLRLKVTQALPQNNGNILNGAELIPALLFGDKFLIDSTDSTLLAEATLAHSMALSGLHLSYAAALGCFIVLLLYRCRPSLALRLPRQKAMLLGGLIPAAIYLWLGASPPSLLRAFCMLLAGAIFLYLHKAKLLGEALTIAVTIILLLSPQAAFDIRLQLSASCIAVIALFMPLLTLINAKFSKGLKAQNTQKNTKWYYKALKYALIILLTSIAIQICILPLLIKTFGLVGLSIPLNILWLPVLGAVVMPCSFAGLILSAIGCNSAAAFFMHLATLPCGWLLNLLHYLHNNAALPVLLPPRPHWLFLLGWWLLLLLIPAIINAIINLIKTNSNIINTQPLLYKNSLAAKLFCCCRQPLIFCTHNPRLSFLLFLSLCLMLYMPLYTAYKNSQNTLRLTVFDVGHGQSVLLEWKGGRRALIDGGGSNSASFDPGKEVVAAHLTQNRQPQLDYMLASHLDLDHAKGLVFLLKHFNVARHADNGQLADKPFTQELTSLLKQNNITRRRLQAGDYIALNSELGLEVLHPGNAASGSSNNSSLVLRIVWQGKGLALLCGDIEKSGQRLMLKNTPHAISADILVLPHHGSANALLPELYSAAKPLAAVASSAYGNSWYFPAAEVRNTLLSMNIPLLNTARTGQIVFEWATPQKAPQIKTARNGLIEF